MARKITREPYLTAAQRRLLFLAQVLVLLGYLITNRLLTHLGGGTTFDIWLDRYIPLWPIWVVPYLSALVWWGISILWSYFRMDDSLYVAFVVGWLITCLVGYSVFVGYPNYMVRPEITGNGWAESVLRFVYGNDRTYNAFPSQHLWTTVLITLFWGRWKPRWRWPLWGYTVVVALSTLYTGQHWIMDVIGGTVLGVAGYFIGLRVATRLATMLKMASRPGRQLTEVSD
jgi:membrane-associated phospholipid phosphatase